MRTLKYLLPLLIAPFCFSQTPTPTTGQPNCVLNFAINSTHLVSANFANSTPNCQTWTWAITSSIGVSAFTLTFKSAPAATSTTPGSFVTYAGTTSTGSNPMTAVGTATFSNGTVAIPWVNITGSGITGAGTIIGVLQGWNSGNSGGGGGGGGGTNECATSSTPCYVVQPTPSLLNDTSVETLFNGATQSKAITCPNRAAVSISGSGETQIIAANGTTQIYICSLDLSGSAGSNFNVAYGTGSNCGTGTTAATGVYQNVLTYSSPWNAVAPLILPAGKAACLNFASSVTVGGTVIYAQF
jgi:hypothetical protein